MLRLYRQFVEQMLMVLVFARDAQILGPGETDAWRQIRDYVFNHSRNPTGLTTQQTADVIRYTFDHNVLETGLTEMINELTRQLSQMHRDAGKRGSADKDLIDAIVRTIQLPYARNRMSGEIMDNLKRALLLPDELAGLKEKLAAEELHCIGCGHKFAHHEMGIVCVQREERGASVMCSNCVTPEKVACQTGKHSIPVASGMQKLIQRSVQPPCGSCELEAAVVKAEAASPPVAPPDGIGGIPVGTDEILISGGGEYFGAPRVNPPRRNQLIEPRWGGSLIEPYRIADENDLPGAALQNRVSQRLREQAEALLRDVPVYWGSTGQIDTVAGPGDAQAEPMRIEPMSVPVSQYFDDDDNEPYDEED